MASGAPGFTDERQRRGAAPNAVGTDYIPTEEERRVFRECNQESFWYRSAPFSVVTMAITQALVARGSLSASPRFGSLPKVAFAGFCGYLAGKMSYMKTCQEKFKRLENSPLGEALRQRSLQYATGPQSEMGDADTSASSDYQSQMATQSRDYAYSPESPVQETLEEDVAASGQLYLDEEEPRQKSILYENLRLKNRENYEVTLTQKAETLMKPTPQRESERPLKDVKKNVYGDTWDE
ncbi:OCIA domain-containing protein 1-like [Eucyclogobius newberryi]|uniref:OCIA domain-containing protein 1-like n=1 Tax=Eucyclogobius newberryi TaxID=166745 RepID=UPI003B59A1E2